MMKKLTGRKGFTLTEFLVTLMICGIVVAFIAGGIPSSYRVYKASLFESESEVLISTVNTELGDMLHYATDIETSGGQVIALTNRETYQTSSTETYYKFGMNGGTISLNNDGHLVFTRYPGDSDPKILVSSGIYREMKIKDFTLTYDEAKLMFKVSYTVYSGDETKSKASGDVYIGALSAQYE